MDFMYPEGTLVMHPMSTGEVPCLCCERKGVITTAIDFVITEPDGSVFDTLCCKCYNEYPDSVLCTYPSCKCAREQVWSINN